MISVSMVLVDLTRGIGDRRGVAGFGVAPHLHGGVRVLGPRPCIAVSGRLPPLSA